MLMKRGLRWTSVVIALLALCVTLAVAQDGATTRVQIDKDRNALIQTSGGMKAPSEDRSHLVLAGDLPTGLTTLILQANVPRESATIKAGTMSMYSEMNNAGGLVLGDWKLELSPEAKMLLNGEGKVQINDKIMHADATANLVVPAPEKPGFTRFSFDGKWNTNVATWGGTFKVDLQGPDLQKSLPVKSFELHVAEQGPGGPAPASPAPGASPIPPVPLDQLTSSVDFSLSVDAASDLGKDIQKWSADKDKIGEGIKMFLEGAKDSKVTVESVAVTKLEVAGDTATFAASIKARGLHEGFKSPLMTFLNEYLSSIPGVTPEVVKAATDSVVQLELDKLDLTVAVDAAGAKVSLDAAARNVDSFMKGYTRVEVAIHEYLTKLAEARSKGDRVTSLFVKWWSAIRSNFAATGVKVSEAIAESGATVDQSLALSVEVKDQALSITANAKEDVSHADKVAAVLKQKGVPVLDQVGMLYNVKTDEKERKLTGQVYVSGRGDMVKVVKSFLVDPAQQTPSLKSAANLLNNVSVTDSRWGASLKDGQLDLQAYLQTSSLADAATALLVEVAPDVKGSPAAVRVDVDTKDGQVKTTESLLVKGFMPGQSDAQVRAAIAKLRPGAVEVDAHAATVALEPVTKPDIKMAESLATVKDNGDKSVMAAVTGAPESPAAAPGEAEKGSNTTLVVGVVIGVLAILGIAFVAMRK